MLRIILVGAGIVLVTLGLLYGPGGFFTSSIVERTDNLARWESEMKTDLAELDAAARKVEELGNRPPSADGQQDYAYAVEALEQRSRNLESMRDIIQDEKDRKKAQIIITSAFVVGGFLAIALGLVLGRRKKLSASVGPIAVAHPAL